MKTICKMIVPLIVLLVFVACGGGGGEGGDGGDTGSGTVIDSSGGIITFTEPSNPLYGLIVDIPAGALSTSETIDVETTNSSIPLPTGITTSGIIISLAPEGLSFNNPITITIPYESPEVPVIVSYNVSTNAYDVLHIIEIDEQNKTVTVETTHFSLIGKVFTDIAERLDTNFDVATDAFSINNTASDFGKGACWGFSSYSQWYFQNKKSTDGNLRDRYGNCEKALLLDAQDTLKTQFLEGLIAISGSLIYPYRQLITLSEINTAFLLDGKPQVLALKNNLFSEGHAVLVYSILPTPSGYTYYVYDNIDNLNAFEITFNKDTNKFDEYNGYTEFYFLGSPWDSDMQKIYDKYIDCPIVDYDPPTIPIELYVNAEASDYIFLDWTPSTDNIDVAGYNVYRDGVYLKSVNVAGTSDYGLNPSTNYCYMISAYDAAGNESDQSSQACATTLPWLGIGSDWTLSTDSTPWNGVHTSLVFNGKMWVLGGSDLGGDGNSVWYSTDGTNWTIATDNAQYGRRYFHASVVFGGKMWVLGGQAPDLSNDVWYSSDGINWTQATDAAQWSPRNTVSVVYDGKIWILGGWDGYNNKTDVWYSSDGINWTKATDALPYVPSASVVYNGKMWILGGWLYPEVQNSVWYSTDGTNWTQATDAAQWVARVDNTSLVFENKMWILGGATNIDYETKNDVWYSSDGINWTQATDAAQWSTRREHTSLVFDNKMWILGGRAGSGGQDFKSDIWYSPPAPVAP